MARAVTIAGSGERGEQDCWNIPLFLQLKKAGVLSEIPGNIIAELTEKAERINVSVLVDKASGYVCGMAWGLAESAELVLTGTEPLIRVMEQPEMGELRKALIWALAF